MIFEEQYQDKHTRFSNLRNLWSFQNIIRTISPFLHRIQEGR